MSLTAWGSRPIDEGGRRYQGEAATGSSGPEPGRGINSGCHQMRQKGRTGGMGRQARQRRRAAHAMTSQHQTFTAVVLSPRSACAVYASRETVGIIARRRRSWLRKAGEKARASSRPSIPRRPRAACAGGCQAAGQYAVVHATLRHALHSSSVRRWPADPSPAIVDAVHQRAPVQRLQLCSGKRHRSTPWKCASMLPMRPCILQIGPRP